MKAFQFQDLLRVGAVAAALTMGAVAVQAMPGGHGGHGRHGGPAAMAGGFGGFGGHMLDVVNATDAQRSQIKAIFKAARDDLAGQREAGVKLHQQLASLYAAPNIDAVAIESLRQQMRAQHEAASKRMSQASIEAARVLTPEQRAKIAELAKKRQARMAERAEHRR